MLRSQCVNHSKPYHNRNPICPLASCCLHPSCSCFLYPTCRHSQPLQLAIVGSTCQYNKLNCLLPAQAHGPSLSMCLHACFVEDHNHDG